MTIDSILAPRADWPPKNDSKRIERIKRYQELFEGDTATVAAWAKKFRKRLYKLDEFVSYPVPEIAVRTLASFLFGEDALLTSEKMPDDLQSLIEDNHLHALNLEAAVPCIVDGEVYYKLDVDETVSDRAIISTVEASAAFPVFKFRRLVEVAFVRSLGKTDGGRILRHAEIRRKGLIEHKLFAGTPTKLGEEIDLADYPETMELAPLTETGVEDLLVRHVPFWRASGDHGISVFRGKEGLVDAIYGLYSQDQHDAEMSKKRVAMAETYIKRDSNNNIVFDRNTDVLALSEEAAGALGSDARPVIPIDFTDSTVMGDRIGQRIDEFLLACGIAPQSAGRDVSGGAESGTARKLAQALTLQTVGTTGRYFKAALKDILDLALYEVEPTMLNRKLPRGKAAMDVQVAMRDGFVDDIVEQTARVAEAKQAGIMSIEQAVTELHPDWSEDEIAAEVQKIIEDEGMRLPTFNDFGDEPEDSSDQEEEEPTSPGAPSDSEPENEGATP